jgi:hypothetical protein
MVHKLEAAICIKNIRDELQRLQRSLSMIRDPHPEFPPGHEPTYADNCSNLLMAIDHNDGLIKTVEARINDRSRATYLGPNIPEWAIEVQNLAILHEDPEPIGLMLMIDSESDSSSRWVDTHITFIGSECLSGLANRIMESLTGHEKAVGISALGSRIVPSYGSQLYVYISKIPDDLLI